MTTAKKGRPALDKPKKAVSIRLDADIVEWFKSQGDGWQTRMNNVLLESTKAPVLDAEKDDDEQLIQDAAHVGKAMLRACRELAEKQGKPLHEFGQAAIQALIVGYSVIVEDDPFLASLKEQGVS